jgi:hypothetical protein
MGNIHNFFQNEIFLGLFQILCLCGLKLDVIVVHLGCHQHLFYYSIRSLSDESLVRVIQLCVFLLNVLTPVLSIFL